MKKLASVFWLELRNLRMFFGTEAARIYIFEIVLSGILLGLVILLITCASVPGPVLR